MLKHRTVWGCVVLAMVLAIGASVTVSAGPFGLFTSQYRLGETIVLRVESQGSLWWSCCCCSTCDNVSITGWRVADSSGTTVYAAVFDAAVASSIWQGSWSQADINGVAVQAGYYTIYVDTSAGTLSKSVRLYDPCSRCWSWCGTCCGCESNATITADCCRFSLVLSTQEVDCCGWLWSSCCSGCP